jgi:flagellar L-ring protein precursor FlgH
MRMTPISLVSVVIAAGVVAAAGGCSRIERLSEVGSEPELSEIANPQKQPGYRPLSLPMPTPEVQERNPNSLWRAGAKAFFKDIRAKEVGDTLTVRLRLDDSAKMQNKTARKRDGSEKAELKAMFGYESDLQSILPKGANKGSAAAEFGSASSTDGTGDINRQEEVDLTFAAIVTQVLPNGTLAIMGRQEVRVNYELRQLLVTGAVRPQDIDADNTVSHEKIAEMRVAYGGRGTLSDLQQPRWGTQIWDLIFPF